MNYLDAWNLAESLHAKQFRCIHISHVMPWEYPHLAHDGDIRISVKKPYDLRF